MAKQSILKIAIVVALSLAASSTVFGATTISAPTSLGGGSFTPSNKVVISVETNGTADSFDGTMYGTVSKHTAGDKNIGSNNADPKLYFKTADVTSDVITATSNMTFDTSWTAM